MKKTKSVQFPIRKRSFLLFELLISLALIVLCLFPLIKPHASLARAAQQELYQMQLEGVAQAAFCQLKEKLYQNELDWDALVEGMSDELNDPFYLVSGTDTKKAVTCTYEIEEIESCNKTSQKKVGLLLAIALHLELNDGIKHTYERTLYLEKAESL